MTNFEEAVIAELLWMRNPRRRSDAVVVERKTNKKAKERRKCTVLLTNEGTNRAPISIFFI